MEDWQFKKGFKELENVSNCHNVFFTKMLLWFKNRPKYTKLVYFIVNQVSITNLIDYIYIYMLLLLIFFFKSEEKKEYSQTCV